MKRVNKEVNCFDMETLFKLTRLVTALHQQVAAAEHVSVSYCSETRDIHWHRGRFVLSLVLLGSKGQFSVQEVT